MTFSYVSTGVYSIDCTSCFTLGKTAFQNVTIISPSFVNDWLFTMSTSSEDAVDIASYESETLTNDILNHIYIEIKVYY